MARDNDEHGKRQRARAARESKRQSLAGTFDWSPDTIIQLGALASVVSRRGGAVRIGHTRDGGALAIGMYLEDDYATEYIRPTEDLSEAVAEIVAAWLPGDVDEFLTLRETLYGLFNGKRR